MYVADELCRIIIGFMAITFVSSFGVNDLRYVFFESPTVYTELNFDQVAAIFANPKFDINIPTVLYVHGYQDSPFSASTKLIVEAYLKKGGRNVFALDWSGLASGSYPSAVINAVEAGTKLGVIYAEYFKNGIPVSNEHLIGHDIGAHLVGQAARTIITSSNGAYKLDRITGLDPAVNLYYPPIPGIQHINRNDATYVDIIHTDGGGYGTPKLTGTADFYVNTGRRFQPGCPVGIFLIRSDNDLCSHRRAIQLWAESVSTPSSTFTATMFANPIISTQMGYNSPKTTIPGKYVVLTNAATPFSRS